MRTRSCDTTRPAPRFKWPTSLLPICPSGSPTARPEADSSVHGYWLMRPSQVGVSARAMAFPSRSRRYPHPSSTMSATGGGALLLLGTVRGYECENDEPEIYCCASTRRNGMIPNGLTNMSYL